MCREMNTDCGGSNGLPRNDQGAKWRLQLSCLSNEALQLSQRGNFPEGFPTFLEAGMETRHVTNQHAAHVSRECHKNFRQRARGVHEETST